MTNLNNVYAQRHYESALDYFEQGQFDKALQQIDKAIQQSPENPDLYATRGIFLHRMNNVVHAVEAYQAALRVAPDHSFSHYKFANLKLVYLHFYHGLSIFGYFINFIVFKNSMLFLP